MIRGGREGPDREMIRDSEGFTLVRLLLVVVSLSVLGGLASPRVQGAVFQRRVAELVGHLEAVGAALSACQAETGEWPGEELPGIIPSDLEGYLPEGMSFTTPGYRLDYDNRQGSDVFGIGLTVITQDEMFGLALMDLLGPGSYRAGNRYTWILAP